MKASIQEFLKNKYNALFAVVLLLGLIIPLFSQIDKYPNSDFRQLVFFKVQIFGFLILLLPFYYLKKDYRYALAIFVTIFTFSTVIINKANHLFHNIGADLWYYNALVSKYKYYSQWLIDSSIKDIPSYLSPLFFLITGKFAAVFNLNSGDALIWFTFFGAFAMPVLYFYLIKGSFDKLVIILTVITGCAFFNYELTIKPYQSISALMALLFYYKLLPKVKDWNSYKVNAAVALFGILLFLTYHYHFIYLAVAFFLDILFRKYIGESESKKAAWSRFGVYVLIFMAGFVFYFLPHLIAVYKAGSSHSIHYGATDKLELAFLAFPVVLGIFDVLRNLNKDYAFRTLVLISALTVLFLMNLFAQHYLKSTLYLFKIYHIIPLILLPHAINFVLNFAFRDIHKKYEPLFAAFSVTILMFYAVEHWSSSMFNMKQMINRGGAFLKNPDEVYDRVKKYVDLKNKVVFFPRMDADLEFGAIVPNFRFLPVNNDYGSFASRIKDRNEILHKLDSVKSNPAAFAYLLMNNNIDHIDYFMWNDDARFFWVNVSKIGQTQNEVVESKLNKSVLSERYFERVNPNVRNLFRLKYENNFLHSKPDQLTFLEKVALGKIKGEYYRQFLDEYKANPSNYTNSDLQDAIFYLKSVESLSSQQVDTILQFISKSSGGYTYEVEEMPSFVKGIELNRLDNQASDHYCRFASPTPGLEGNVLFFGPYITLTKGKYMLKVFVKSNKNTDETVLNLNIISGKVGLFTSGVIKSSEVYSLNAYKAISIPFEVPQVVEDFEVVGYYNTASNADISVDKYEIIPY